MKIEGGFSTKVKEQMYKVAGLVFKPVNKSDKTKTAKKKEVKENNTEILEKIDDDIQEEKVKTVEVTDRISKAKPTATKKRYRKKK